MQRLSSAKEPYGTPRDRFCGGSISGARRSTATTPRPGRMMCSQRPNMSAASASAERGGLVVALANGFHFFDPATGRFDAIVDPEADRRDTRFDDGKPDRQGRFWSGT